VYEKFFDFFRRILVGAARFELATPTPLDSFREERLSEPNCPIHAMPMMSIERGLFLNRR